MLLSVSGVTCYLFGLLVAVLVIRLPRSSLMWYKAVFSRWCPYTCRWRHSSYLTRGSGDMVHALRSACDVFCRRRRYVLVSVSPGLHGFGILRCRTSSCVAEYDVALTPYSAPSLSSSSSGAASSPVSSPVSSPAASSPAASSPSAAPSRTSSSSSAAPSPTPLESERQSEGPLFDDGAPRPAQPWRGGRRRVRAERARATRDAEQPLKQL